MMPMSALLGLRHIATGTGRNPIPADVGAAHPGDDVVILDKRTARTVDGLVVLGDVGAARPVGDAPRGNVGIATFGDDVVARDVGAACPDKVAPAAVGRGNVVVKVVGKG